MTNNDIIIGLDIDTTCYTCGETGEHHPDCPEIPDSTPLTSSN